MNNVLDIVRRSAEQWPEKVAVITHDGTITYAQLYERMLNVEPLPIPLLGEAWDKDFILHTTGTTGRSKDVIVSQRAVMANTENLIEGHHYSHDIIFIITGDMTHLGCWSKIFPTLAVGGTLLILKDGMKDLEAFFQAMERRGRFATFLVPATIRMLLQFTGNRLGEYADRIDFIETGAAPMPRADMLTLCRLLPNTRLYNTYASTETGICATYNYNYNCNCNCNRNEDEKCLAGCLGRPLKHSAIHIDADGRICCSGDTLMSGYLDAPDLTRSVLYDGMLHTTDLGYLDADGMLHLTGRADDVINVGGYKVAPSEVEDAAMSMPEIADCICRPRQHPILGFAPELHVVMHEGATFDPKAIARHISQQLKERYKVPLYYKCVTSVPRNANGKLVRG